MEDVWSGSAVSAADPREATLPQNVKMSKMQSLSEVDVTPSGQGTKRESKCRKHRAYFQGAQKQSSGSKEKQNQRWGRFLKFSWGR